MCGIAGFAGKQDNKEEILERMMDVIKHRGPDSEGKYTTEDVAFGFRRLSIIDLESGSQPMFNEDGQIALIFNGEIYNSPELRERFQAKGHVFANRSDSETLIHGYEEYGEKLVHELRGMFGFAIWDNRKKRLFLARDFFGIKPVYYAVINNNLVFGSEIKSILEFPGYKKEVNMEALEQYLSFQYSSLPETFFKGIYRLLPGHYLTWSNGELNITQYFDPTLEPVSKDSQETLVKKLDEVLDDSVQKHMLADVEVGAFLSSGVDSSYIAAKYSGKKTFTVGFFDKENQYNETHYAEECAKYLGLENYSHTITEEEYWGEMPKIMWHMDEPLADPAAIALYFVAREAAKQVKVVTSGEGADEFFGGYTIYREPLSLRWINWLPASWRRAMAKLAEKLPEGTKGRSYIIRASKTVQERFIGNANIFSAQERKELLKEKTNAVTPQELLAPQYKKMQQYDDTTKMQYIDLTNWLPGDILLKADKMSMAHSLELRVPFLDKEVFKAARSIRTNMKLKDKTTKFAFRRVAEKYLPEFTTNKKKLGFPVPIRVWLKEDTGYGKVREAFTGAAANRFFYTDKILRLLDDHKNGVRDNSRKIWTVYTFLVWYKVFFEDVKSA
ncbi:asparagine synthase (glutamine-hydrolyzing) [Marvinbryantia formatexigens DSM 14469]|uniref:asparagine synthase (glutamine-hydrolyzing) n=1 Tax=Marvinbryantia formatexigens DSM 14469 TaxID=478749 RepID=C6LEJ2_9FIRM|nr:asparagine synthase (glutamine-hydrolyzing) [Marvinbryantia formatexigens]EET60975.1 asparagine synthase (glutamine-hydrolyzing) [Marvinbryantia formatexigens DSM 14469]UWO24737.1 asparagine synthase (glutamine-hydrolyzing) [Marvinbryantia formatexigens DSM 14469]SDF21270.1 asparagine synthase (glutamine-hydrolysing) [Marvinbryantia formatexigens]